MSRHGEGVIYPETKANQNTPLYLLLYFHCFYLPLYLLLDFFPSFLQQCLCLTEDYSGYKGLQFCFESSGAVRPGAGGCRSLQPPLGAGLVPKLWKQLMDLAGNLFILWRFSGPGSSCCPINSLNRNLI